VVAAVSGGADSLALLYALAYLARESAFPFFELHVAHLDHGLRGRAGREDARFVRRCARRLKLPCTIGRVDAAAYRRRQGLSLEEAARQLRYRFLAQTAARIGAGKVATGHHREDQVETVLLHFLRGAGLDGLSGMPAKRSLGSQGGFLVRPLLEISRREIERFCRSLSLTPRVDETNRELRFRRNRIRRELLPCLEKHYNPRVRESIGRLACILALENDCLQGLAAQQLQQLLRPEQAPGDAGRSLHLERAGFCRAHPALQARMIRMGAGQLLQAFPRNLTFRHVQEALHLCCGPGRSGELHFPGGLRVQLAGDRITLALQRERAEPPAAFSPALLPVPGEVDLENSPYRLRSRRRDRAQLSWPPPGPQEAYLDFQRVRDLAAAPGSPQEGATGAEKEDVSFTLLVRPRRDGDRFYPLGAPGSKKLKDYFIDKKIPRQERDRIPLVTAGETIIWVAGYQVSQLCRVTAETGEVLVLQLEDQSIGRESHV